MARTIRPDSPELRLLPGVQIPVLDSNAAVKRQSRRKVSLPGLKPETFERTPRSAFPCPPSGETRHTDGSPV